MLIPETGHLLSLEGINLGRQRQRNLDPRRRSEKHFRHSLGRIGAPNSFLRGKPYHWQAFADKIADGVGGGNHCDDYEADCRYG